MNSLSSRGSWLICDVTSYVRKCLYYIESYLDFLSRRRIKDILI